MKLPTLMLFAIFALSLIVPVFPQDEAPTKNPNELIVSNEDLIIIFSSFIVAVIAIFLYLARNQILRKKFSYDMGDYESKKNRDYEKYHSDWTSEEFVGKKSVNKDDEEFRKPMQNSNFPNYYKILEVSNDATQGEIKNQFRRLVKEWHKLTKRMKFYQIKSAGKITTSILISRKFKEIIQFLI